MANIDQESSPLVESMQQSEDHLKIDIPEEDLEPGPECCIYKVPKRLRKVKKEAYTPQLVSIGPIPHGDKNLAKMEKQKLRYYNKFSQRTSKEKLEEFRSFIKENAKHISTCYDRFLFEIEFKASKFVTMILVDAVFIIELFLRHFDRLEDDFLLDREWVNLELSMDLKLLENQLPFFVLEDLYNLAFGSSDKPSFLHLTCIYFDFKEDLSHQKEIKHFTDLARYQVVREITSESVEKVDNLYNATMLHEAGVDFKAVQDEDSLLTVQFEKGELRVPTFYLRNSTEAEIRNLMALEQCHYPEKAYVCSYIQLLDYLVDTEKDVDLLEKKGIFLIDLNQILKDVDMFNNMFQNLVFATTKS